jgi:iron complex outermembrane recepter protein
MNPSRLLAYPSVCLCLALNLGGAEELRIVEFDPFVTTSAWEQKPLTIDLDARSAVQPMPAQDGADFLKHVPGFSVVRKGGTDGDPVLRGQAGSRLSVLIEGECLLGGCGQRMDPPTAYVFPASYDRVIIMKGPQTVIYGPGNSAGIVRFERDTPVFSDQGYNGRFFLSTGSFDRYDVGIEGVAGNERIYGRVHSTYSESGDYKNGLGNAVHSEYSRWSVGGAIGWTPDDSALLELTANRSDGEAAYADRLMDGVKFDRENLGVRFKKQAITDTLESFEAQVYYNYIDHVMDNFSLRPFTPNMMMPNPAVLNPDRLTWGGRAAISLSLSESLQSLLGVDFQINEHTILKTANEPQMPYEQKERMDDGNFQQVGLFGELASEHGEKGKFIVGGRLDFWEAEDQRPTIALGTMGAVSNPTSSAERSETLLGGFARYEYELASDWGKVYAGLGYVSRFPDYWELFSKEVQDSVSAFETDFEKTMQIDVGWLIDRGAWSGSISLFSADHDDFILIESNVVKTGAMASRLATVSRNIDATTRGGEISISYRFDNGFYSNGSVAYVRGSNKTDDQPLAQMPPLEGRLEAGYRNQKWSFGCLLRLVEKQNRVAVNQGNIVGQDLGTSPSFSVFSVHAGWLLKEGLNFTAGVDNLFDEDYAEHISRAGSGVSGYLQTFRVLETGRTFWIRMSARF